MKIAWASDVHFDFVDEDQVLAWCAEILASGAECLLLGGDIATAADLPQWLTLVADFLAPLPLYFVLGNHDYYRGSIAEVQAAAPSWPGTWLPAAGPISLEPGLKLAGQGGWGDARVGDFLNSHVVLNDYRLIAELAQACFDRGRLLPLLRAEGAREAASLAPHLESALSSSPRVLVLTHVPPFREACWHEGRVSDDDWAPGFVCGAVGELLLAAAARHPAVELTVLCGHTHSPGWARLAPNLVVHTLGATYGAPGFALLETEDLAGFSPPGAPPRG